jgi:hypothetical protein
MEGSFAYVSKSFLSKLILNLYTCQLRSMRRNTTITQTPEPIMTPMGMLSDHHALFCLLASPAYSNTGTKIKKTQPMCQGPGPFRNIGTVDKLPSNIVKYSLQDTEIVMLCEAKERVELV